MRVKTGKFVLLLGVWTFLSFLLKETFPKAAYANSTTGCAMQPACLAMLRAEVGHAIAAPTGQAATISVTTASGATTTTQAVAKVAIVENRRIAGIAAYYVWDQLVNEQGQNKVRESYCAANPSDVVCVPFKGGQLPGVRYGVTVDRYTSGPKYRDYTSSTYTEVFGPIEGIVIGRPSDINVGGAFEGTLIARYEDGRILRHVVLAGSSAGGPDSLTHNAYAKIASIVRRDGQPDTGGNPPPLTWKDWPQAKRDAAVKLLSPSDWLELIGSMQDAGLVGPGDKINASGGIIVPGLDTDDPNTPQNERDSKKIPGPSYTLPPSASTAQWPSYLNIPGLNNKEKALLKIRVEKKHLTEQDVQKGKFRTIPNDPDNRKCFYTELTKHLGDEDYPDHSQYATQVTGSPGDLFMMTPDGINFATYDGAVKTGGTAKMYGETDGAVTEVKTQHSWLLKLVDGYPLVRKEPSKWSNLQQQLMFQAKVAQKCELRYFIAFEREDVVKRFGPKLVDMLKKHYPPIRVRHIPFNKTSSSSSLGDSIAKSLTTELALPLTTSLAQQSAKGKLVVELEVLFDKHDINHSELAHKPIFYRGAVVAAEGFQLSRVIPNGGQQDFGGWNRAEPDKQIPQTDTTTATDQN